MTNCRDRLACLRQTADEVDRSRICSQGIRVIEVLPAEPMRRNPQVRLIKDQINIELISFLAVNGGLDFASFGERFSAKPPTLSAPRAGFPVQIAQTHPSPGWRLSCQQHLRS